VTQQPKTTKNLQYLLDKQELINQEIEQINEGKEQLIVLGFGLMSKEQALDLKARQQKMLSFLRVWTVPEIEQAKELLHARMCKVCQRSFNHEEQPQCKDDFSRFVNAIMFKRALAA
jgi:hypothetical protein